jgi:hypothetical protein
VDFSCAVTGRPIQLTPLDGALYQSPHYVSASQKFRLKKVTVTLLRFCQPKLSIEEGDSHRGALGWLKPARRFITVEFIVRRDRSLYSINAP